MIGETELLTLPKRIQDKIDFEVADCWYWTAALSSDGYGKIYFMGKTHLAHRVVYELLIGPIPFDMELHHTCGNRNCVWPEHLEFIVSDEHKRHKKNKLRTHCKYGHEFTEDNKYWRTDSWFECRKCRREAGKRFRRAHW